MNLKTGAPSYIQQEYSAMNFLKHVAEFALFYIVSRSVVTNARHSMKIEST